MGPIHLFEIAAQRNQWLGVRQTAIAENIANANTPGFKAKDVEPFEAVLNNTQMSMTTSNTRHIAMTPSATAGSGETRSETWETSHSGNSVSLEEELIKSGEINRNFSLNTNIMKSFHRMILASARG